MLIDTVWLFIAVAFWNPTDFSSVEHRSMVFQTRHECVQMRSRYIEDTQKRLPELKFVAECIPLAGPGFNR